MYYEAYTAFNEEMLMDNLRQAFEAIGLDEALVLRLAEAARKAAEGNQEKLENIKRAVEILTNPAILEAIKFQQPPANTIEDSAPGPLLQEASAAKARKSPPLQNINLSLRQWGIIKQKVQNGFTIEKDKSFFVKSRLFFDSRTNEIVLMTYKWDSSKRMSVVDKGYALASITQQGEGVLITFYPINDNDPPIVKLGREGLDNLIRQALGRNEGMGRG